MNNNIISVESAKSLGGLLRERAKRTPEALANRQFDNASQRWEELNYAQLAEHTARWQAALRNENLQPGDRVAVMLRNCREWAMFDFAALGLGLVVVPLFTEDRPENAAYVIADSGAKILLLEGNEQWQRLKVARDQFGGLQRLLSLEPVADADARHRLVKDWLPQSAGEFQVADIELSSLATIVYTSGTTGRPKGAMLSHKNILSNAYAGLSSFDVLPSDTFLSFLPLSHMLERMGGYYLPIMAGAGIIYARSVAQLAEDLQLQRPTLLISVPRIYERVYARINEQLSQGPAFRKKLFEFATAVGWARFEHAQGRGPWKLSFLLWPVLNALVGKKIMRRLGGRLRTAISGGAALSPTISRVFIGLGLPILQGYGLTETSPVLTVCRVDANDPASVGKAVPDTELKIGANSELLARGPQIMLGYWGNAQATQAVLEPDGWFHTGDQARIDANGNVFITGRIKDVLVLANGEKVPPVDMELAIATDPLFEQVMILGEGKPYLSCIAVLNADLWNKLARERGLGADARALKSETMEKLLLERVAASLAAFPGYAQVRRIAVTLEPWSIDNDMLTPTMKVKRARVVERFAGEVSALYQPRTA